MRIPILCVFLALLGSILPGCGSEERTPENTVSVSILPQKHFVEKIAGDKFRVNVMVPGDRSPETYEPTPRQMEDLSRSKIYFQIGLLPFEHAWMEKLASAAPKMRIVDTSEGVALIADGCGHGCGGDHAHAADPHIWLSPRAVKVQAGHILDALVAADPENEAFYRANCEKFLAEIDSVARRIAGELAEHSGRTFLVFHPAWGYFARDYGLVQLAVEAGGKEPTSQGLKDLIDVARRESIRAVFLQRQFSTHSAETIASEIGARLERLDPLAEDWSKNMVSMARAIAGGWR